MFISAKAVQQKNNTFGILKRISMLVLVLFPALLFAARQGSCYSELKNDTLKIGNELIERVFVWNGGNLRTYCLADKTSRQSWINKSENSDFSISRERVKATDGKFSSSKVADNSIHPDYLEATVIFSLGGLDVKRIYRIYDNVPVIACDTYLKGVSEDINRDGVLNSADLKNIEFAEDMKSKQAAAVLDQISLSGKHWQVKAVEFFDVTDWNNNLVSEKSFISYRKNIYRGNLLFAENKEIGAGLFFLKEAPSSGVQIAYSGGDFVADAGHFMVTGLGINGSDLLVDNWRRAYGSVVGVFNGGEIGQLTALRSYQKNIRKLLPARDEMVMMNTWGDRSQDSKINEKFSLVEVEKAAELGITHFQIDDGWQTGKSPNSATAKGSFKNIWDNPDYWKPDPIKYPNGLHPIVTRGKELGVEICLWFNPSVQDDYADWEKDAQAMIDLYREYGIRTFKIDGLAIPTKKSEANLRKLFNRVLEQTNNNVVFNLDATAGRRGGFHMFNEYGNIFLENRYTDWQNYYPYWTLRNLWQLSKYVPAEKMQVEFLNKWRNSEKYGDDVFAPNNYSFEYLFATTMAAQPLAWFEGSGLPNEAMAVKRLISDYKNIQHDFHLGTILPIGDEPSGRSWTGFQSINGKTGYLLIFRENNPNKKAAIKTWLAEKTRVKCTPVLGNAKSMTRTIGSDGIIEAELANENDFVMYKYEILK